MPSAFRLYQRHKLININVNIIASGMLAIAVAKYPVELATDRMPEHWHLAKSVVMALIDGAADVLIYYVLHWVANHWRPAHETPPDRGRFWRNATLVQFERYALSPLFYAIAMGLSYTLMRTGTLSDSWAFVVGFGSAILVTRALHTAWMIRKGRHHDPGGGSTPDAGNGADHDDRDA